MAEHVIALRRAWKGSFGEETRRVDLPAVLPEGEVPLLLERSFHRPTAGSPSESIFLRFEDVPGLKSAALNGHKFDVESSDGAFWECCIDEFLLRNNFLAIGLEVSRVPTGRAWGRIGIVIRESGTPRPSTERL